MFGKPNITINPTDNRLKSIVNQLVEAIGSTRSATSMTQIYTLLYYSGFHFPLSPIWPLYNPI